MDEDREKLAALLPVMRKIPQRVRQLLELVLGVRDQFDDDQIPNWLEEMHECLEQLELYTRDLTQIIELLDFLVGKIGFDRDVG